MKRTFVPLLALLVLLPPFVEAAPPQWWYDRGVISDTQPPNDYAAVNQGQLKNIAVQAAAEMDAHLPGGAGDTVHNLIATWGTPTAMTNDFTAVNLGQLKALATPFYDQLRLVGYSYAYPWNPDQSLVNNYAAANIGQVKNLFAFDLMAVTAANDLNSNGIADWWEHAYNLPPGFDVNAIAPRGDMSYLQAFQQGLNPNDFYNGQTPSLSVVGGDQQTAGAGGFVPQALAVQVCAAGQIAANAPVTFTVTQNGGLVQATMSSSPASAVTVKTNDSGIARSFFSLPNTPSTICQITATAATGSNQASQTFTETAGDSSSKVQSTLYSVSNLSSTFDSNEIETMTWTNNTDDPIPIWHHESNGDWTLITTVPAGTTSYTFPAP